jgi:uncharacterized protein (DUF362 family)/NAD-dependent dihydropyrimidine dehydrogenase PreA subunit
MARVCISKIRDQEIDDALEFCLNKIGIDQMLTGVQKVLIKPNFVNSSPARMGVTTDLRIVLGLIRFLKKHGISEIIVGESSLENTEKVFESLGIYKFKELGVSVINFDKDEWVEVVSPTSLVLRKIHVARAAFECDLFISVAKMKTHSETGVTLSIKNTLGAVSKSDRKIAHATNIDKAIVDVFSYFVKNKKFLSIVDGVYALEGKLGPTTGNVIKMDLIIVGDDAVATDAVCIGIMGYDASKIRHVSISDKLGLGKMSNVTIIGEKIEDVKRKFEMPMLRPSFILAKKIFRKRPYLRFREKCIYCKACIKTCPMGAISIQRDKIKINYKKCISCLVCCESCMQGVLDYKMNFFASFLYPLLEKYGELKRALRKGNVY